MRRLGFSEGSSGPQGAPGTMFEAAASWHSPFVLLAPSRSPRVPQGPVTCGCLKALCLCADRRSNCMKEFSSTVDSKKKNNFARCASFGSA